MTPVSDSALESLHATATEIFTGALEACNIASAFDRRIRFEGNTLHAPAARRQRSGDDQSRAATSASLSSRWARPPGPCLKSCWTA